MPGPQPEIPGVPVEHSYVDVRGLRMHVASAGPADAEPVILLHGWPQHWLAWRHLIGPLSADYRVHCPDLRGFGWTGAPRGSYEKSVLAADVLALLDELGLERVRLAGHDWGGFAGFLLCMDAPGRVSHFLAAGIPHPWVRPDRGLVATLSTARRLSYMALISTPLLGRAIVQRVPAFVRTLLRLSAADPDRAWGPAELASYVDQWREPDRAAACVGIYRSFLTRELPALARGAFRDRRIEIPVTLLTGAADPVIRPELLGGAERNAPAMRIEVVPGTGHWIAEEAPGEVLAQMRELFARG